jgi:hypothetical protein
MDQIWDSHGVSLWKSICGEWDSFYNLLRFEIRDGSRVRFWNNIWCIERSRKYQFPDLLALAVDKEASEASYEVNNSEREVRHWNSQFIQPFQDWELESVDFFF